MPSLPQGPARETPRRPCDSVFGVLCAVLALAQPPKGRALNWRRELLLLLAAAMDALWLAPWAALLAGTLGGPFPRPGALCLGALLWATLLLTRLLGATPLPLRAQRVGLGLWTVAVELFLIGWTLYPQYALMGRLHLWPADVLRMEGSGPAGLVLLCVALYLGWRGMALAQQSPSLTAIGRSLRLGILAWLALYLIGTPEAWAPVGGLYAYFSLGLMAVGLSRVEELQQEPGMVRSPFAGSWLLILAGGSLGASGAGLALSGLVSSRAAAGVAHALSPVGRLVQGALFALLTLIGMLLSPLLDLLLGALGPVAQSLVDTPAPGSAPTPAVPGAPGPLAAVWHLAAWPLAGLALIALAALATLGVERRRKQREGDSPREATWEAERVAEAGAPGQPLQALRRRFGAGMAAALGAAYSLITVRQIYAALLRLAARKGLPRAEAETPLEYQRRLVGAWPGIEAEIASLTAAYVRSHYGERAPAPGEVEALRQAWKRIQDHPG